MARRQKKQVSGADTGAAEGEVAASGAGRRSRRGGGREPVRRQVTSGTAELQPDRESDQAWSLLLDGAPQSHVDLAEPTRLAFEYQRRLARALDLLAPPGRPVAVLHLGGGALTLPRYLAATRPRSRQQVAEIDQQLTEFVREHLPLDRTWQIRVRGGDARDVLARTPEGWADAVVADVFSGARVPAHCTSVEFVESAARALTPAGWYAANVADGGRLDFVRGQVATLRAVFPHVALAADPAVLRGRRYGNVILLASREPLPTAEWGRLLAGGGGTVRVLAEQEAADFQAGAAPVTDATAVASPTPPPGTFAD